MKREKQSLRDNFFKNHDTRVQIKKKRENLGEMYHFLGKNRL